MMRRVARINLVRRDRRRSGAEGGTGGQHSIKAAAGFWQKMMGCIGTVGAAAAVMYTSYSYPNIQTLLRVIDGVTADNGIFGTRMEPTYAQS